MNFRPNDDSLGKIIYIFDHIGEILNIDLYHYSYGDNNGVIHFKMKVSDDTGFRKNKNKTTNTILNERTKYNCRVLLQIQSVYYNNNKVILEDIDYYPQGFLQQILYTSLLIINYLMMFLILQILSQRVNLMKSLMKILHKGITTIF